MRGISPTTVVAVALLAVACSPNTSGRPATSVVAGSGSAERRPVIIDTDVGADDIQALAMLLREPSIDVRAITVAGTGLAHCGPGVRNVRALVAALDVDELPIACGREAGTGGARPFPEDWRTTTDLAYGSALAQEPDTDAPSEAATVMADAIEASPTPPTIVALGPWTNLADAFSARPGILEEVAGIHAMAGSIDAPGNVEIDDVTVDDGIEWNVMADPGAFADVLALDIPVTLTPLDATDDVPVPPDYASRLASEPRAAGADIAYELYVRSPFLAAEGQQMWDQLTALALVHPEVVTMSEATVRVLTGGRDAGRIVRDDGGRPITYASAARTDAAVEGILAALRVGSPREEPFTGSAMIAGTG